MSQAPAIFSRRNVRAGEPDPDRDQAVQSQGPAADSAGDRWLQGWLWLRVPVVGRLQGLLKGFEKMFVLFFVAEKLANSSYTGSVTSGLIALNSSVVRVWEQPR